MAGHRSRLLPLNVPYDSEGIGVEGVDQEGLLEDEVTLTESIDALRPNNGRDTKLRPFLENSLDNVLDFEATEKEETAELSLMSDATDDSLERTKKEFTLTKKIVKSTLLVILLKKPLLLRNFCQKKSNFSSFYTVR